MRLVFLHGFTQTHHHWHGPAESIRRATDPGATLAYVDLPGHGLAAGDCQPLAAAGTPLARIGGPGTWVGYSMGARFALHAALADQHAIDRLVLIGGTAGIADPAERAARVERDEALADQLADGDVDGFLDRWLAAPMFATLPRHPADLRHRRRNTAAGLAASLRAAGTGAQDPLWGRLTEVAVPVLCLAGELDTKFVTLGRELAGALPLGEFAEVPGAGHAAHTERPEAVAATIADWLAR